MNEKRIPVKVVKVVWPCEACGKGEMEYVKGNSHLTITPFREHKCNVCGHTDDARNKIYPRIEYERVDESPAFQKPPKKLYLSIFTDRYNDVYVRVFDTPEKAISYAKKLAKDYAMRPEDIQETMCCGRWLYNCVFSPEGYSVRVEESELVNE